MAWKATGQPTVRKQRDKWVVRVDGIDTATGKVRPRQLGSYASPRAAGLTSLHLMTSLSKRGVNLAEKLGQFDQHWAPRTVAQFNGHDVMVVKVKGEFVWHHHDNTDDFFLVLKGRITIRLHDGDVDLGPGELFVVPAGTEHQPYAPDEAELLLIEPAGTPNTGDESTAAARVVI